ncbi:hypothetical protein EBR57_04325 [bacterium]|nr:hypothetical protein [bacterium]
MVSAMDHCDVRRIIVLTGAGIHLPGDHPNWLDRAMAALIRVMAADRFNDGDKAIRKLIATDLDWTIVRTELQHNGVGSKVGHVGPVGDPAHSLRCSRGYIAQFIADCLKSPTHIRSAPKISD